MTSHRHIHVVICSLGILLSAQLARGQSVDGLVETLARIKEYLVAYELALSAVVAEERYEQRIEAGKPSPNASPGRTRESAVFGPSNRILVSDFLMIRWPGESAWLGFRDVMSVDGALVRDRHNRLVQLFTDGSNDTLKDAELISKESTRYNIGAVSRNLNVPTQVLDFLHPRLSDHFSFRHLGTDTLQAAAVLKIGFEETKEPYLIKTTSGRGVRARGIAWVDERTGAVLQTQLDLMVTESRNQLRSRITVVFGIESELGIRVPRALRETHEQFDPSGRVGGAVITHGQAEYSKFRRFRTETREQLK